jgi:drug/metabolite transporter (DMT)-like permease
VTVSERAIVLVVLSAFLHASWNIFSKSSGDPISFLLRALAFSALLYAPLFVWMQFHVHYPPVVVGCLLGSGICAGVYFFCLGKAYHHGRVSVAYPVARSFPILVVMFGGFFLSEFPNAQGTTGVLLVVAGCFVLPWERFVRGPEGFCLANYHNRSVFWALGAAALTSAYSLLDKIAAASMAAGAESTIVEKVNYVYLQNLIAWGAAVVCVRVARYRVLPVARRRAFLCGAIFLVSYTLVLLALATDPVAYVVSFRQLSIVLGTLVSMFWIERSFSWPRVVGVGMIFTGVVLVGLA